MIYVRWCLYLQRPRALLVFFFSLLLFCCVWDVSEHQPLGSMQDVRSRLYKNVATRLQHCLPPVQRVVLSYTLLWCLLVSSVFPFLVYPSFVSLGLCVSLGVASGFPLTCLIASAPVPHHATIISFGETFLGPRCPHAMHSSILSFFFVLTLPHHHHPWTNQPLIFLYCILC